MNETETHGLVHRLPPSEPGGAIYFAPILHGKMEFAQEVQRQFFTVRPDVIAVELPKTLETPITRAVRRLPFLSVVLYEEQDGTTVYLPLEPTDGLIEAVRLGVEYQTPVCFIDRDTEGYPRVQERAPDSYSIVKIGYAAYIAAYFQATAHLAATDADRLREATMAYHLQRLRAQSAKVLCVCGLAHAARLFALLERPQAQPLGRTKRDGVIVANLHAESSREVMTEIPYLAAAYERERGQMQPLDRLRVQAQLLQDARARHFVNSKEELGPAQLLVLHQFARNYALIQAQLTPDFYQLVIAARGAVNDNYAYEVWDIGSSYPWQDRNPKLPTIELRGEDLFLNQKQIRFHRTFRSLRKRLVPVPVKTRPKEARKGEWQEQWEGRQICSHPPEDIVIEGYGRYIQKKTVTLLAAEQQRVVPFTTSLLDGIDMRETIRNWHEQKLYVVENRTMQGKVGSVVVIFDEDRQEASPPRGAGRHRVKPTEKYPWKMTWLGEHQDESDMAFYATPAGAQLVGPGIARCVYGGFMLTYPPLRVFDVWQDAFFDLAQSKAERLLLAAIDYATEKLIAYVAAKPPRSWCYRFAAKLNKKVVYLPIGHFSPPMLKKIQVFHVLDGHATREYAKEYIW